MDARDFFDKVSILEAVDNLSSMSELDVEEFELANEANEGSKLKLRTSRWIHPDNELKTISSVKNTFKAVHNYLEHVYAKEANNLQDEDVQKGIKSIITLATEAADKIDKYSKLFNEKKSIKQTKEFRDLIDFYHNKILKKFEEVIQEEESWREELAIKEDVADIQRRGLKDLESVTRDRDYELFFINKEDGSLFYNKNLIRHIRLVADFDQLISTLSGDDPLLKIKIIQDRQYQMKANNLKNFIKKDLDKWINNAGKYRDDQFIFILYKAITALFLAANPHNLLMNTTGKSSISYFNDFKFFLRESLNNVDYQYIINNYQNDIDVFYKHTLTLLNNICYYIYVNELDKSYQLAFFVRIIQKNELKHSKSARSSISFWNEILDNHEMLYNELKKYPSGPLFKMLDILYDTKQNDFDPYLQDDNPSQAFIIHVYNKKVKLLVSPCPTAQKLINKANIIPEFTGFMRSIIERGERVLIINFQDRTSWKEFTRSFTIEEYQKNAELTNNLYVVTIPKHTDFYLQSDNYIKVSDAEDFKKNLINQIDGKEDCGFCFPKKFNLIDILDYVNYCVEMIHKVFFDKKEILSRKNRLDFIELFYQFLISKMLKISKADYIIFSAKDTIDIPSTSSAAFYSFIKLFKGDLEWNDMEKEAVISSIFLPALLIRERAVDIRYLNREISMLSLISSKMEIDKDNTIKYFT